MIHGTGIDISSTSRIGRALKRWGPRLKARVFTEGERAYSDAQPRPELAYAARFSAKESFIKALSPSEPVRLREIEVVREKTGEPSIRLHGRAEELFRATVGNGKIHLSLSHEMDYAVAVVIIEIP